MEEPPKYRVQIRQYPRAGGTTWRWWVFDRRGGTHLDTGVIIGGDRAAVERAAAYAIELLKQQKREWSPELPAGAPRNHTALGRAETRATANSKHGL
jgi:hypothetical protein